MRVFLSHSQTDRPIAAELRSRLQAQGVTIKDVDDVPPAAGARQRIDDAIRSSDAVLLLINSGAPHDRTEDIVWQEALGAAWDNPKLRLVPVLLRDSKLPGFVRSAASGDKVPAVRIKDPRDIGSATGSILSLLQPERSGQPEDRRVRGNGSGTLPYSRDVIPDRPIKPGFGEAGDDPIPDDGCLKGGYGEAGDDPILDVGAMPGFGAPADDPAPDIEMYSSVTDEDRARRREWVDELREYARKLNT